MSAAALAVRRFRGDFRAHRAVAAELGVALAIAPAALFAPQTPFCALLDPRLRTSAA